MYFTIGLLLALIYIVLGLINIITNFDKSGIIINFNNLIEDVKTEGEATWLIVCNMLLLFGIGTFTIIAWPVIILAFVIMKITKTI